MPFRHKCALPLAAVMAWTPVAARANYDTDVIEHVTIVQYPIPTVSSLLECGVTLNGRGHFVKFSGYYGFQYKLPDHSVMAVQFVNETGSFTRVGAYTLRRAKFDGHSIIDARVCAGSVCIEDSIPLVATPQVSDYRSNISATCRSYVGADRKLRASFKDWPPDQPHTPSPAMARPDGEKSLHP